MGIQQIPIPDVGLALLGSALGLALKPGCSPLSDQLDGVDIAYTQPGVADIPQPEDGQHPYNGMTGLVEIGADKDEG